MTIPAAFAITFALITDVESVAGTVAKKYLETISFATQQNIYLRIMHPSK